MATCLALRSAKLAYHSTRSSTKLPIRQVACSAAPSNGGTSGIEPPNVEKLAQLAQVGVSEQEAAEWGPKIASIVDWFGQLQQVDLEGVPPALRADVDTSGLLRPDQPHDFAQQESMLKQVPERDGSFVRVPKMAQNEAQD